MGAERIMLGYLPGLLSPLHALVVGSTLVEYNVHHLFNRAAGAVLWSRYAWQIHAGLTLAGGALCAIALLHLPWTIWVACGALGLLALAYSTPLLPFRFKARLKDYGIIKIHVLTGVWVLSTTVLPALYWGIPLRLYWMEIIIRALLIFPLCIAFDIRDAQQDEARGIHTLPNTLGIPTAYRVINFNLLAYFAWAVMRCLYRYTHAQLIVYALSGLVAWAAIRLSRRRNPYPYVYLALIDGVMLVYGVLECVT